MLRAPDGSYVVSTYREVMALIHDPRLTKAGASAPESFIGMDPPGHDWLRAPATRHFDQSAATRPQMERISPASSTRCRAGTRSTSSTTSPTPFRAPPPMVFTAVTEGAGRLLATDVTILRRREPSGRLTTVGAWCRTGGAYMAPAAPRSKAAAPVSIGGRLWA